MSETERINRIKELQKRKARASYQRKITTELAVAIEYDMEVAAIDRRLNQLKLF